MTERISTVEFNRRVACGELVVDAKGKWVESAKATKPKAQKYGNRITEVDGHKFDSALEAKHYRYLKQQQAAGVIASFKCQVRYPITDAVLNEDGSIYAKKIDYIADFAITHLDGHVEVVDVKGMVLDLYELKRSVMWFRHSIKITEVFKGGKTREQAKKSNRKQGAANG